MTEHEAALPEESSPQTEQQTWSAVEPQPRRSHPVGDPLAERRRSWVVVGIALCLVVIFTAIWVTYARAHTTDRYVQLPAGAGATINGSTLNVVSLKQTDVVTDGEKTNPSQAGAVWVIATMEVTIQHKQSLVNCDVVLLADGDRTWESQTMFFDRKLPQYCGAIDRVPIKIGVPWRFEQIFEVPARFGDRILGVAVPDAGSAAPTKVIRPPAGS